MERAASDPAHAGTASDSREISRAEIRRRLRDPALVLVDVLPAAAYAAAHIPGALNLPLAELAQRASVLVPARGAEIAVYCASFS